MSSIAFALAVRFNWRWRIASERARAIIRSFWAALFASIWN